MRNTCLECVYALAKADERIVFIGSDLGNGVLDNFKKEIPNRFFMEGISEAQLVSMAAGLAMDGKIPYVNTIATFLTRRCYEQNVLDLGLHNTRVRLLGNGGGFVYAPLGPTHQATDDIAIMRTIPGMTIIAPADAVEMKRLMPLTVDIDGPVYVRIAKGFDPVVTEGLGDYKIGRAMSFPGGDDGLICTTGVTLQPALEAQKNLATQGQRVSVLHFPTIKPLDIQALFAHCAKTHHLVTIEEHNLAGGFGSMIVEALVDAGLHQSLRIDRLGIPDRFSEQYGSQQHLMEHFGIHSKNILLLFKAKKD